MAVAPRRRHRWLVSAVLIAPALCALGLALGGCRAATAPDARGGGVQADAAAASAGAPGAVSAPAAASTPAPVEFALGGHRFALPAGYFADGRGPDARGAVQLVLSWPQLEAYAPGDSGAAPAALPERAVIVSLQALAPAEVGGIPERFVSPAPGAGAGNPALDIAARLRGPALHGLEQYRIDPARLAAYRAPADAGAPAPQPYAFGTGAAWFVARDPAGRIRTAILCDPVAAAADANDDAAAATPEAWAALCDGHSFVLPEYALWVKAGYRRPILRDWRRIETAVSALLRAAHRGAVPTEQGQRP